MSVIYYELPDYGDDVLMHHGIKGMKWGIRRTAEQLGHFAKKVYKTGKDIRAERIENTKSNAIASGNYDKIKKYEKYMTDAEIKSATDRMNAMSQLRNASAENPNRSKQLDKQINKAIANADYQKVAKLQKHMTNEEFDQVYKRLDTSKKLKDAYEKSTVEKGIQVMETVARVGTAALNIGKNVQGFRDLKKQKAESKQKLQEAKNKEADAKDPTKKAYLDKVRDLAMKDGEKILSDKSVGSLSVRQKVAAKNVTEAVANASAYYDRNKKIYDKWLKSQKLK